MQGLNRTIMLTQRTLLAQLNILRRGRNLLSPLKTKECSVWWLNLPAGDCNIVPFSVPQQLKRWKSMTTNRILLRISAIELHSYYYYFISSTLSNIEYDEDEGRCSLPHLGWWVSTWMEGFGRFVPWFRGFQQSSSHLATRSKTRRLRIETRDEENIRLYCFLKRTNWWNHLTSTRLFLYFWSISAIQCNFLCSGWRLNEKWIQFKEAAIFAKIMFRWLFNGISVAHLNPPIRKGSICYKSIDKSQDFITYLSDTLWLPD